MKTIGPMLLSTILLLALTTQAIGPAVAAPLPAIAAPSAPSLAVPVHGCHRFAQDSLEGWHRHVGPYCRWVRSGPSQRSPYSRCRTRCQYFGPIKQCWRDCW